MPCCLLCWRSGKRRPPDRPQTHSTRNWFPFSLPQLVKREIDYWSRVKGQDLRNDQTSHDSDAERLAQFAADTHSDGERQGTEHRGHRCHHDRPEPNETRLVDRFFGTESFVSLSVEREIDHHDRVLFHDADEQDNSDDRDEIQLIAGCQHSQESTKAGGWYCRKDREWVDQALVKHSQDDVNGQERREKQPWHCHPRGLSNLRRAGETSPNARWHSEITFRPLD